MKKKSIDQSIPLENLADVPGDSVQKELSRAEARAKPKGEVSLSRPKFEELLMGIAHMIKPNMDQSVYLLIQKKLDELYGVPTDFEPNDVGKKLAD